jgi:hypothetical protein
MRRDANKNTIIVIDIAYSIRLIGQLPMHIFLKSEDVHGLSNFCDPAARRIRVAHHKMGSRTGNRALSDEPGTIVVINNSM